MSSVVISGDTSGAITLAAPAVSGTNTATLPAATGTVMVSGNMPAFSYYLGTNQSISSASNTKVQINTKVFDTNNYFDTTNYRFTPLIAGYYQINIAINTSANVVNLAPYLSKNGSVYQYSNQVATADGASATFLVYLNGSSDYVEFYVYISTGGGTASSGATNTWMSGCLVRTA